MHNGIAVDQKLPIGLYNSLDIIQEIRNDLFHGLEYVRAYVDVLLIISNGNFEDHLYKGVNYYRNMWEHIPDILPPLTQMKCTQVTWN